MTLDWTHVGLLGRSPTADAPWNVEAALRRLQRPVLWITFEGDRKTPTRVVDHFGTLTRRHLIMQRQGIGSLDHSDWLTCPDEVVHVVIEWLAGPLALPLPASSKAQ